MPPSPNAANLPIYQLKVTLEGSKPPIWRRFLVPGDASLGDLHAIIQAAFDWWDYHLHQFIVEGVYYGQPNPDYWGYEEMQDEENVTLRQIVPGAGYKFRYEYDFGDSWLHRIQVEKILAPEPGQVYPVCLKGRRACPPEDVGGIGGFYAYLEAIQDPDHPEHDEYLEWRGEFDPEAFDLEGVNQALQKLERR